MKSNMGNLDRVLRIIVALAVIALYFTHIISGMVAIVGLALAGVFILTSFVGSNRLSADSRTLPSASASVATKSGTNLA